MNFVCSAPLAWKQSVEHWTATPPCGGRKMGRRETSCSAKLGRKQKWSPTNKVKTGGPFIPSGVSEGDALFPLPARWRLQNFSTSRSAKNILAASPKSSAKKPARTEGPFVMDPILFVAPMAKPWSKANMPRDGGKELGRQPTEL